MKILRAPRIERCVGCDSCSLACARLVHKRISWTTAGIRITSSGGLSTGFEAKLCLACDPAPCAAACPTGSFSQRKGGGVRVKPDVCIRCGACAKACPVDAIYIEPETSIPFVCLHCGRCVAFCPHQCLEMIEAPETSDAPGAPVEPVAPVAPVAPVEPVEPPVSAGVEEKEALHVG